ncbi:ACP S-malonyltransferase [soil metagenome]
MNLAFVFPGQGSQSVGMLAGFEGHDVVRGAFEEASVPIGVDLWKLAQSGPVEDLNLTVNTQPVMLAADIAIYRAWTALDAPLPELVAGHSLGEYAALVAAGSFTLAQASALVRFRAESMQAAVPVGVGGMAAILGLDGQAVIDVCRSAAQGEVVEAVNFNDPMQTVIAGHRGAVERACVLAKEAGAKRALTLPVSAPFHSSLLQPAADRLAERLAGEAVQAPRVPVINNIDVAIADTPAAIRDALARQAASAVRWVDTIRRMQAEGVTHIVECGPGKVLAGLVKRIAPTIATFNILDADSLETTAGALS